MPITHPVAPMTYPNAILYVENFLFEHMLNDEARALPNVKVTVEDYFDRDPAGLTARPWAGVRVSEVGFSFSEPTRSGGASYMQTDQPWGIAVCGQVERCILALLEGWNRHQQESGGETYGEGDEEFNRLQCLIDYPPVSEEPRDTRLSDLEDRVADLQETVGDLQDTVGGLRIDVDTTVNDLDELHRDFGAHEHDD